MNKKISETKFQIDDQQQVTVEGLGEIGHLETAELDGLALYKLIECLKSFDH